MGVTTTAVEEMRKMLRQWLVGSNLASSYPDVMKRQNTKLTCPIGTTLVWTDVDCFDNRSAQVSSNTLSEPKLPSSSKHGPQRRVSWRSGCLSGCGL